jgi:hypothetical protein
MANQTPDFWKKLEILLAPVGGLLTALSVAIIGSWGAYILHNKQETETRTKVYAELMSQHWQTRLDQVAADVVRNQLLVLEEVGKKFDRTIDLNVLNRDPGSVALDPERVTLAGIERVFRLVPLKADIPNQKVQFRLEITALKPYPETKSVTFWVGYYDFPMIDNTRLSADQRCAVVLDNFCEDSECKAEVTAVVFPGSRASLQEKTFSEDVIRQLQKPGSTKE